MLRKETKKKHIELVLVGKLNGNGITIKYATKTDWMEETHRSKASSHLKLHQFLKT